MAEPITSSLTEHIRNNAIGNAIVDTLFTDPDRLRRWVSLMATPEYSTRELWGHRDQTQALRNAVKPISEALQSLHHDLQKKRILFGTKLDVCAQVQDVMRRLSPVPAWFVDFALSAFFGDRWDLSTASAWHVQRMLELCFMRLPRICIPPSCIPVGYARHGSMRAPNGDSVAILDSIVKDFADVSLDLSPPFSHWRESSWILFQERAYRKTQCTQAMLNARTDAVAMFWVLSGSSEHVYAVPAHSALANALAQDPHVRCAYMDAILNSTMPRGTVHHAYALDFDSEVTAQWAEVLTPTFKFKSTNLTPAASPTVPTVPTLAAAAPTLVTEPTNDIPLPEWQYMKQPLTIYLKHLVWRKSGTASLSTGLVHASAGCSGHGYLCHDTESMQMRNWRYGYTAASGMPECVPISCPILVSDALHESIFHAYHINWTRTCHELRPIHLHSMLRFEDADFLTHKVVAVCVSRTIFLVSIPHAISSPWLDHLMTRGWSVQLEPGMLSPEFIATVMCNNAEEYTAAMHAWFRLLNHYVSDAKFCTLHYGHIEPIDCPTLCA